MRRKVFILSMSLLLVSIVAPVRRANEPDFSALEKVILEEIREKNAPGAAVAVISKGRVVFSKGFGISNVETGATVTPDMLFRLGSTTKMFTAAALVALSEEGRIDLNLPVGNYTRGLHPRLAQLTAHQLLTHTAGVRDDAPMYGLHDDSALSNEVRSWKEDRLFTEPGRIISYSNPGYWLAGFVIEEVSRKPYADQLNDALFKPAGMNSTTLRPTMAMTFPLAQGHNISNGKPVVVRPMADNSASWPAGSIFSSVADLARFVTAFVNGGKLDGKQVLSASLIAKLSEPRVKIPASDSHYGYGLVIREHRGVRIIQHGGSRSGYGSIIAMSPEHGFGVIALGNRSGVSLSRTAEKAMELMLPLGPEVKESEKEIPMSEAEMARYVGVYVQQPQRFELLIKDGKLYGKRGNTEGVVKKIGEGRFSIAMPAGSQPFALVAGADGRAEYLHISLRAAKRQQ
ncbi:MAG: serine hydrolase domain-containing protein [Acidobacteriota bacterium]